MKNIKKNKIIKFVLFGLIGLSSVGGMLVNNIINNSSLVSANQAANKANVTITDTNNAVLATKKYDLPIYVYSYTFVTEGAGGNNTTTYVNKKLVKSFASESDFENNSYTYTGYSNLQSLSPLYVTGMSYVFSTTPLDVNTIEKNGTQAMKIVIQIADNTSPVISGYEGVYFTNYDNPITLEDLMTNIRAIDETDGTIEVKIEEDGYTGKEKVLGSHFIKLSATDKSGNKNEITIDVRVVDGTAPTIDGIKNYTSNMSSPITEATIRAGITATDNQDNQLDIILIDDSFTGNEQKVGSYTITYKAVDDSTNESAIHNITINVVDDIKPTITGESNYNVSSIGKLEVDYIKEQLTANDNVDDNLNIELVYDNYTPYSSIVGEHKIYFKVVDSAGNESEIFEAKINVVDNIPPVFWVNDDFFNVDETVTLTHQQIIDVLLTQTGINPDDVTDYSANEEMSYNVNNENKAGTYTLSYRLQMKDGTVMDLNGEVNVIGQEDIVDKIEDKEKVKNLWQKTGDFFSNLWNWIVKYLGFGWLWDKDNKYNPTW